MPALRPAPPWRIAHWLNTPAPLSLEAMRSRAVLAVAFQMLCPGCVAHALPQAMRARATFRPEDLAVVGLHTVFEHHEAQGTIAALDAFLHEYRIDFPVGIDAASDGDRIPQTMRAYGMQGTPTTLLIDAAGRLRMQSFGHVEDLRLGAAIQAVIEEGARTDVPGPSRAGEVCTPYGCGPGGAG